MPAQPALSSALARLESRWGSAAVKVGLGVPGADAQAPAPAGVDNASDEIVPTGFARLDALLGTGGLPRGVSASFRGAPSSGKTALALHCLAQAQARGAIVAFVDLCRIFDPLEAAARGVDLRWLLVIRPADVPEGFSLAGALLAGRAVDLLIVDLPSRLPARTDASLRRLAAHARRVGARLMVLEPASLSGPVHGALAESTGLRLELERRGWIRLGRDVVGQHTQVTVAKNRYGTPGRHTDLEIHYLTDGDRSLAAHRFAGTT